MPDYDIPAGVFAPQWGGPSLSGIDSAVAARTAQQPQYQPPQLPSLAQNIGSAAGDIVSWPKRMFRAGVGLDPNGSAVDDLQNLGMGRTPAAWLGSVADNVGDPSMLAGMATNAVGEGGALVKRLASSPASKSFLAGDSGAFAPDEVAKFFGRPVSAAPTQAWTEAAAVPDAQRQAADLWSRGGNKVVSPLLRSGGQVPQGLTGQTVDELSKLTQAYQAPSESMLYRGATRLGDLTPESAAKMVGQTVTEPSFTATTPSVENQFYNRPGNMQLDIIHPQGGNAAPLFNVPGATAYQNESEILLPKGMQYKVLGTKAGDNGGINVLLQALGLPQV